MSLRRFLSASALVVVGMVAGRVLGMLREILLAAQFGVGPEGNLAIALLMIPDFVTSALIGAAVSAALVPAFAAREPQRALALLWQSLLVSLVLFSVLVALLVLAGPHLLAPFETTEIAGLERALLLALISIPLAVATAVLTAFLQHKQRFLIPAFATVFFNLVIVGALVLGANTLYALGIAIFAAAAFRLLPHIISFVRSEPALSLRLTPWELDKKLLRNYALAAGNSFFGLVPIYAPYAIAAILGSSIALFNYAFKLVLLPGILGQTVIQLVLLPWLISARKAGQTLDALALQASWAMGLALMISLNFAAQPIATLFFHYGKMTETDITAIGDLFAIGVWALPAMFVSATWQTLFYSVERAAAPFVASLVQAALLLPLGVLGHYYAGLEGMMLALVVLQYVNVITLAILAKRTGLSTNLLPGKPYFSASFAILATTAPFALLFANIALAPSLVLALSVLCGIVALLAAAWCLPPARAQLTAWMKRGNDPHHQ